MSTATLTLHLEEVARAMLLTMKENLNDAIDTVWAEMEDEDTAYYAALGESVPTTPKLYPARFFLGHHPSILYRPPEDYPNVTAVSYRHRSVLDTTDQMEFAGNTAYVEAFLMHEDESTINRLAWRYAKAIHLVFAEHRELDDREIWRTTWTPNIDISNADARRVEEFKEDITYIQGCRLEWEFRTPGAWD